MATARNELKAYIFSAVNISSILTVLGSAVSTTNRRIYAGWPQEQPTLSDIEPSEGWLTFHEFAFSKPFNEGHYEDHTFQFNIWHKLDSQADIVLDVLDSLFDNPSVDQYGYTISSDFIVLISQRVSGNSIYEEEIKLYRKICNYIFRTTKIPYRIGS